ncbi:serine/threonine protein kinase [Kribbella flavida DSM 17836]|uniref:Serine/threonine protein kinase n=1 Tax=Kribbella flavida (strain DSM 17836 / JCM 10339 / NBRC 14399) TaxID=479435 RepID=D2PYM6_KRIFD|nr:protein kinase [Kribbella flavida]ADB29872.1 serine/threonine protein kinase [Kribbella flavida DSM 17836]
MTVMAEISVEQLVPRATGPVASVYLLAPAAAGGRTTVLKVYPQPLDRRTFNAVEVEQAKLAGLRSAASIVLAESLDELPDGRTGVRAEFCPQALPELVAEGPLPIGDVVVLGQILCSVLAEAHELGVVHGGVTPHNVVERASGQPALADFGLALRLRFPRDLTAEAAYTAPEVLRDGELSPQADVYGLGAVLYLALTGQPPFPLRTGETPEDVVLRVLREPVPEVAGRDVPPALTAVLERMMAKEPDDRPEAVEALAVFEALLAAPDEPQADEVDFDDFRDELAAARLTQHHYVQAAPRTAPRPVAAVQARTTWKPSKGTLIGLGAALAVAAVLVVVLVPWGSPPDKTPAGQIPTLQTPVTPTHTITSAVQVQLKPPQDRGTSVVLEWSSSKPLTYVVNVALQGGGEAERIYRGTGTTTTVAVTPGLKYCFEVMASEGTAVYISAPQPLRGATCRRR